MNRLFFLIIKKCCFQGQHLQRRCQWWTWMTTYTPNSRIQLMKTYRFLKMSKQLLKCLLSNSLNFFWNVTYKVYSKASSGKSAVVFQYANAVAFISRIIIKEYFFVFSDDFKIHMQILFQNVIPVMVINIY